jgi:DNA-binding GntR family transcriptional regulator
MPRAAAEPVPLHGANGPTRSALVKASLERDILSGRLAPGTRLDEEGIGRRFGVSRTPVREAFKQLASAGLIELKPHTGAYVARLTAATVVEMFEMMAILESSCARLAARRHGKDDRDALEAAHEACRKALRRKDPDRFYEANARLHEAIYHASGNAYVEGQTRALRNRLEPYRRTTTFHEGLMERSMVEHQRVIDAILSMDENAAGASMDSHVDTLRSDALSMVEALGRATARRNGEGR